MKSKAFPIISVANKTKNRKESLIIKVFKPIIL